MLNQVVLVGRLTQDPEVVKTDNGKSVANICLAVQRNFKNSKGVYETDFINCTLWEAIASNTSEYCRKGDIVGVKGRMQTSSYEDKEGKKEIKLEIVAEKVTFLSGPHKDKDNQER